MTMAPASLWEDGWRVFCAVAGLDPAEVDGKLDNLSEPQRRAWNDWALRRAVDGFNFLYDYTKLRAGKLRPRCVFDSERIAFKEKVTETQSWNDIPTCKEAGLPIDYVMLRGIFMAGGVTPEQTQFYVDLMTKVRATQEWKDYMQRGAFNTTFMTGAEFKKWLEAAEANHRTLMTEAGFLAK